MRRWLLALFALQFFCSVSAFTFTSASAGDPTHQGVAAAAEVSGGSFEAVQKTAASALDPTHGLMDDIPELPECLDVAMGAAIFPTPWAIPRDHPFAPWTPPALDGPQRPPRSFTALA